MTSIGSQAFFGCTSLTGVYFLGNAPGNGLDTSVFYGDDQATVYYLPGTLGWGSTFEGHPTALWQPILGSTGSLGVGTNGFGFNVTWTSGMSVVVDASTNLDSPAWLPLATNILTRDSFYFTDPGWTNYPSRFYRARWP